MKSQNNFRCSMPVRPRKYVSQTQCYVSITMVASLPFEMAKLVRYLQGWPGTRTTDFEASVQLTRKRKPNMFKRTPFFRETWLKRKSRGMSNMCLRRETLEEKP